MAITFTDLRTTINQANSITGWTGTVTAGTADPDPIESTGWVGANIGAEIFDSYFTLAAATDLSDHIIYCWVFSRLSLGNTIDTNGGLMVLLSDATPDRIGFKVAGADIAAFRHDNGPTGWQCPALDTTSLPASPLVRAGAAANLDLTNITAVGTIVNSLVSAPGMNPTYNADIMRYLVVSANNGCAADIIGGTSGTPGLWSEVAEADRQTGALQAHGLVRQLAAGAFGVQGPLRFGNAAGTSASWFEDSNVTVVFEDRGFRTNLYKIFITDNGTGTTTFRLHSSALIAPVGVGAEFDADTDTDVTDVVIDNGSRIAGFTNGVGLQPGHLVTDTVITGCGQVRANGATLNGSSILQSTVAANNSSLQWNVNTDPDGLIDNLTFDKTTATAHHAIEFGTAIASAASFTLRDCAFGTDFSAGLNTTVGDETFHFLNTTGTITLNLIGCTGNKGYRSEGVTVTIVDDPVTTQYTVTNTSGTAISGARVFLETSDATGPLPFEEAVTITQTAGTATVTHTAHGIPDGTNVVIRGADQNGYNKVAVISVVNANSYTYSVDSGTVSPSTGTEVASGVIIHTTTNGSGIVSDTRVFSSSQPFKGSIRDSSGSPYHQAATVTGTVSNTAGFTAIIALLSDE